MSAANQNASNGGKTNSTSLPSSTMDPALDTFYSVLGVSICTVGIVANISVVLAFLTHHRLRTKVNAFLVSLAVGDLLLTGISMPLEMEWHIRSEFIHHVVVCELMYLIHVLTLTSSSLNLLAISIYRYLTIAYPFLTRSVASFHVKLAIAMVWIYSSITASLPLMGWRSDPSTTLGNVCNFSIEFEFVFFVLTANWLLPAVLVLLFYGLIFRIARIQAIKIVRNKVLTEHEKTQSPLFKGAKTLAKIAAVYLICWFPYVIEVLAVLSGAPKYKEVHYTFVFLCYASAAINPFLYAGLCKDFREVFSKCANKAFNQLCVVFRCISSSPRRIAATLSTSHSRNRQYSERCSPFRRSRTTSGISSDNQQQSAATFV